MRSSSTAGRTTVGRSARRPRVRRPNPRRDPIASREAGPAAVEHRQGLTVAVIDVGDARRQVAFDEQRDHEAVVRDVDVLDRYRPMLLAGNAPSSAASAGRAASSRTARRWGVCSEGRARRGPWRGRPRGGETSGAASAAADRASDGTGRCAAQPQAPVRPSWRGRSRSPGSRGRRGPTRPAAKPMHPELRVAGRGLACGAPGRRARRLDTQALLPSETAPCGTAPAGPPTTHIPGRQGALALRPMTRLR
jgi:hypothetical protein